MLTYQNISPSKKAFIFELDNVLYPEKDYLLQVYYLFANFIEFTEAFPTASELSSFFKISFESYGAESIFEKAEGAYGIDKKYKDNFDRLHHTAKLPLKLLLFTHMLSFMQEIVIDRKLLFVLTNGSPHQQLNKIRQIEWNGLEDYLTVYFANEISPKPETDILTYILKKHKLLRRELVIVGNSHTDEEFAASGGVDYIKSTDFT